MPMKILMDSVREKVQLYLSIFIQVFELHEYTANHLLSNQELTLFREILCETKHSSYNCIRDFSLFCHVLSVFLSANNFREVYEVQPMSPP